MIRASRMIAVTMGVVACVLAGSVQANIITGDFSVVGFGYGATDNSGTACWTTTETSGSNTSTTSGAFSFVPTVTGGSDSPSGPTFPDRVLSSGGGSGMVAWDKTFSASIVGSWTGTTPWDAAANPNYRTTLEITSIRIWAHAWDADPAPYSLWFHESTAGNTGDSASIVPLHGNGNVADANTFNHLTWDPADVQVAGTTSTRTFSLVGTLGSSSEIPVDGFEVFGKVHLTYDAVPEPSTLALLAIGLIGLLAYAWRKRK